ncbi:hypothetical protein ABVK25_008211 [Lepraria finkii]|uniref:Uncharacterized protein n=1 Tax=Lepraria finkii TaxID=1340010 RepID=A0ABR4B128_9LECA
MNTSNTKAKEPRGIRTIHITNVVRAFAQRTLKQENRWLRQQVESPDRDGISIGCGAGGFRHLNQKGPGSGELYPEAQQVLARLEREREAARRAAGVRAGKYVEDWFEVGGDRGGEDREGLL